MRVDVSRLLPGFLLLTVTALDKYAVGGAVPLVPTLFDVVARIAFSTLGWTLDL